MGYTEVLQELEEQIKQCKNEQEYLDKQKEAAISTKNLALKIGVSIQSVSNKIKRLLAEDKIKCIKGIMNDEKNKAGFNWTKRYVLTKEYCEKQKIWNK